MEQGPHDDALLLAELAAFGADRLGRLEIPLGVLVLCQFDGPDQAHAIGLAHQRMLAQGAEAGEKNGRNFSHMTESVAALVELQGLDRHRRGHRMGTVGKGVPETADADRLLLDDLHQLRRQHHRRDRQIGG